MSKEPELSQELAALEARSQELAEGGSLPRGALPGLFRALRAASREEAAAALPALAARLGDWPLVAPTLELVRERELSEVWRAALEGVIRAGAQEPSTKEPSTKEPSTKEPSPKEPSTKERSGPRWCALAQVGALLRLAAPGPEQLLRLLELLTAEAPGDPTPLALELGVEPLCAGLFELLRARLSAPAERRDRTSSRLVRGAITTAARVVPDALELQTLVSQVVVAETRRAGDAEPLLAVEALDALALAPVAVRVRLLIGLPRALGPLKRKKPLERTEALLQAALEEMGAGPQDLAELTARTGGLEPDGVARVRLEGDEDARLTIDPAGEVVASIPEGTSPGERRAVESATEELRAARRELVRRLEQAMVSGRTWRLVPWRTIFLEHPLWRDLATRLVWWARAGERRTAFTLEPDPAAPGGWVARDLFGDPLALDEGSEVSLLHPLELEPEELELWRERALKAGEGARAAPLLQLFRPVLPSGAEELARFAGRDVYRADLEELARRSGWTGLPLAGSPPWSLRRDLPGVRVELVLEDAPAAAARATTTPRARRPARRPGLGGDDDEDDEEEGARPRKREQRPRRPPPEAAPRARIQAVKTHPRADDAARAPIALAEARRDLEALSDPLAAPTDLWLREWQENRWRDPQGAWKAAVLRYRQGSPGLLAVRRALLGELLPRLGFAARLEDRFLIYGPFVLELGTGLVHEGPPKDHLPAWRVDEEAARGNEGQPAPALPFEAEADPETVRIVGLAIGLCRRSAQRAAEAPSGD